MKIERTEYAIRLKHTNRFIVIPDVLYPYWEYTDNIEKADLWTFKESAERFAKEYLVNDDAEIISVTTTIEYDQGV